MRIRILCPAPPGSRAGNRVTALRWSRILRKLGHRVTIQPSFQGGPCDLLVALHARHSARSARRYRRLHPANPLLLALTGTDVYHDIRWKGPARRTLDLADRFIVLQPLAVRQLPRRLRAKARVIFQSVEPTTPKPSPTLGAFEVCVVGHLRPIKDPFLAARAVRKLPGSSRLRVLHAGRALTRSMERMARAETGRNPRYSWLGDLPRWKARRLIARSRLLVLSSRMEGGAHVLSEAAVDGVPVLSSRIDGSVGLLGEGYPGFFPCGDTRALRRLLLRAEADPAYLAGLKRRIGSRASLFDPFREEATWRSLLAEISPRTKGGNRSH